MQVLQYGSLSAAIIVESADLARAVCFSLNYVGDLSVT